MPCSTTWSRDQEIPWPDGIEPIKVVARKYPGALGAACFVCARARLLGDRVRCSRARACYWDQHCKHAVVNFTPHALGCCCSEDGVHTFTSLKLEDKGDREGGRKGGREGGMREDREGGSNTTSIGNNFSPQGERRPFIAADRACSAMIHRASYVVSDVT